MGQRMTNFAPIALVVFATLLLPVGAKGQGINANELVRVCDGEYENAEAICKMYIWGAIEGMQLGADASAFNSGFTEDEAMRDHAQTLLGVCDSETVTRGQQFEVVQRYIRNNPQSWHQPSVILIHRALMEAFPCR